MGEGGAGGFTRLLTAYFLGLLDVYTLIPALASIINILFLTVPGFRRLAKQRRGTTVCFHVIWSWLVMACDIYQYEYRQHHRGKGFVAWSAVCL